MLWRRLLCSYQVAPSDSNITHCVLVALDKNTFSINPSPASTKTVINLTTSISTANLCGS